MLRVDPITNTNTWAKAGVMFRSDTTASAAFAFVAVTPGQGVTFQWRASAGATYGFTAVSGVVAPEWVKLVRTGKSFSGYSSSNGSTWTQIGTAQVLGGNRKGVTTH